MANNQDFALSGNDLFFQNGDFAIAESDIQHISDTLNSFPGWWKENPSDGIGAFSYLNSAGQEQKLRRNIQIQLQSDNYTSAPIVTTDSNGGLTINPNVT